MRDARRRFHVAEKDLSNLLKFLDRMGSVGTVRDFSRWGSLAWYLCICECKNLLGRETRPPAVFHVFVAEPWWPPLGEHHVWWCIVQMSNFFDMAEFGAVLEMPDWVLVDRLGEAGMVSDLLLPWPVILASPSSGQEDLCALDVLMATAYRVFALEAAAAGHGEQFQQDQNVLAELFGLWLDAYMHFWLTQSKPPKRLEQYVWRKCTAWIVHVVDDRPCISLGLALFLEYITRSFSKSGIARALEAFGWHPALFFAAVPLCVRTFQHHRERRHVQPFSTLLTAAFQGMCEVWSRSSCIADIVAPPRVLRMAAQTCIWDQFDKRATVGGKSSIFWEMVDPYRMYLILPPPLLQEINRLWR
jgi:hypothetical protein